jgi:hypothetical protein
MVRAMQFSHVATCSIPRLFDVHYPPRPLCVPISTCTSHLAPGSITYVLGQRGSGNNCSIDSESIRAASYLVLARCRFEHEALGLELEKIDSLIGCLSCIWTDTLPMVYYTIWYFCRDFLY